MSDAVPRPTTDTRLRTLVVEDDPTDRKLLEELLRQRGHEVESHADPGAALDAFRDGRHDLVLLDMGLPGMDGASLCRKIRKVPRSRDTFIVSITGSDQVESLESALQSGADDFIAKPLDRDHFRIRLAVAERQVQSAREQKRLTEELTRNQALDPLTGLESQPSLMEHVGDAIQRAAREPDFIFAVLELNLDDFALASSRVGQETGDLLLRAAGNRIRPTVRAVDMVARGAGDGFLILLNGIKDVSDAVRVANRIQEAFTTPFLIGQHSELISVGIGIALSLSGYEDAEQIVRDAHRALRWAKAEGPATSRIFDPEMHSLAQRRIQTEDRIRSALAEDRLELWYQPILSVETMRIRGFEALVRMRDTGGELISPGEFIPVAEESGLIVPLGWWVLEEALKRLVEWQTRVPADPPLCVSANVSARQLAEPGFYEAMRKYVTGVPIEASSFHLEITETALMAEVESTVATLERLRSLDMPLHIDDFGTGYSSLSYLCRLPVDALKIDRSFVDAMDRSAEDHEVVKTVIGLAHALQMEVVAEGVETEEQLDQLRELGGDLVQGYLLHRPMPPQDVEKLLSSAALEAASSRTVERDGRVEQSDRGSELTTSLPPGDEREEQRGTHTASVQQRTARRADDATAVAGSGVPHPPVPARALLLSVLALAVPLLATLAQAPLTDELDILIWLPAFLPAFLLTYYKGWGGASVALAAGMATLALSQSVLWLAEEQPPEWPFLLSMIFGLVLLCFAVGWFGELLHRARRNAENAALRDPLTGLPNRALLRTFLDKTFAQAERGGALTVVIFDLDHFKAINDVHGHQAGDETLKAFANVLTEHTRRSDLSARFGGEEFVSVLTGAGGARGARIFADRVRVALRDYSLDWGPVTASAGIADYYDGVASPDMLLGEADRALYQAKGTGRDRVLVASEMHPAPRGPRRTGSSPRQPTAPTPPSVALVSLASEAEPANPHLCHHT